MAAAERASRAEETRASFSLLLFRCLSFSLSFCLPAGLCGACAGRVERRYLNGRLSAEVLPPGGARRRALLFSEQH
ncbi:hypothetical protein BZA05DRAFT_405033 [Tricharina praecox]|uniref:uncharacterized protein n=1 Tax=Tricharina praecox TaxID=43433 RepID=UPI00221E6E09|nr:uncharacterized protein BZA05DRAFT_405033 [Tricharina praecox]KAI5847496.1 hypothetical protein BZA05DRAFT_405033 [Tricharina praecox]